MGQRFQGKALFPGCASSFKRVWSQPVVCSFKAGWLAILHRDGFKVGDGAEDSSVKKARDTMTGWSSWIDLFLKPLSHPIPHMTFKVHLVFELRQVDLESSQDSKAQDSEPQLFS